MVLAFTVFLFVVDLKGYQYFPEVSSDIWLGVIIIDAVAFIIAAVGAYIIEKYDVGIDLFNVAKYVGLVIMLACVIVGVLFISYHIQFTQYLAATTIVGLFLFIVGNQLARR